jgi:hypothetical protein
MKKLILFAWIATSSLSIFSQVYKFNLRYGGGSKNLQILSGDSSLLYKHPIESDLFSNRYFGLNNIEYTINLTDSLVICDCKKSSKEKFKITSYHFEGDKLFYTCNGWACYYDTDWMRGYRLWELNPNMHIDEVNKITGLPAFVTFIKNTDNTYRVASYSATCLHLGGWWGNDVDPLHAWPSR